MDQQKIEYQGSKIKQRLWKGFTHTCAHTHTQKKREGETERLRETERERERRETCRNSGTT